MQKHPPCKDPLSLRIDSSSSICSRHEMRVLYMAIKLTDLETSACRLHIISKLTTLIVVPDMSVEEDYH
jgi:hypothetical protein